jgi:hypothetical protein
MTPPGESLSLRILACLLLLLTSCGTTATTLPAALELPGLADLPAAGPARSAAALQTLQGNDEFDAGGDGQVTFGLGDVQLATDAGELAWTLYRFDGGASDVASQLSISASGPYWVAISDFSADRWEHLGQFTDLAAPALDAAPGRYSNGAFIYLAVLAYGGQTATITSITLDVGSGPALQDVITFGTAGADEFAQRCAVAPNGDVVLAGWGSAVGRVSAVRFDGAGVVQWAREVQVPDLTLPDALACTAADQTIISGFARLDIQDDNRSAVLVALGPAGQLLWSRAFTLPGDEVVFERRVFLPVGDDVVVYLKNHLFRVAADGTVVWCRSIDTLSIHALVLDAGKLYAAADKNINTAPVFARFDAATGGLDYAYEWGLTHTWFGQRRNLVRDANGDFAMGYPNSANSGFEVMRFAADGTLLGQFGYDQGAPPFGWVNGLAVDSAGNLAVAIEARGGAMDLQPEACGLVRFSLDGTLLSSELLPSQYAARFLCSGPAGKLYIAGLRRAPADPPALTPAGGAMYATNRVVTPLPLVDAAAAPPAVTTIDAQVTEYAGDTSGHPDTEQMLAIFNY